MDRETLVKIGTLGGALKVNKKNLWMYGGDTPGLSKGKLFGKIGKGPLHPGMPRTREVTLGATQSDTKQTLIQELTDQTHMTRREAEEAVSELLRSGALEEVNDPTLGKVLVVKNRRGGLNHGEGNRLQ